MIGVAVRACGDLDLHLDLDARATWQRRDPDRRACVRALLAENLDEQLRGSARPVSDLGRSLRFGVVAGALSVLAAEGAIDDETARASLVAAGGNGKKFERMWERFAAQPAEA